MNPSFYFFVEGTPAPGGSKTFFPVWRGNQLVTKVLPSGKVWPIIRVVDDAGEKNKEWRARVALEGRRYMQNAPAFNEPMKVEFIFFLRRPKAHYRTGKYAHILRDDAPKEHTQVPDALKFARSTEDALTGIIWKDDSSTIRICSEKRWALPTEKEGCAIKIVVLRFGSLGI